MFHPRLPLALLMCLASVGASPAPPGLERLRLLPRPQSVVETRGCSAPPPGAVLAALPRGADDGGPSLVRERWTALGIRPTSPAVGFREARLSEATSSEAYGLDIDRDGVVMRAATADGRFDAFATLAQLPIRRGGGWALPCVRIADAPALRWRILSDDVSRGPLPTMRYFEERIRTIAGFKYNGYSPYMEHVFVSPSHPLAAPVDGITPAQLRQLATYARRYHVAFIPEQQTFAHMHESLRLERYAPLAELPHGYLLSPAVPGGEAYVRDLIGEELDAVPHPPFFHIGSDEPSDLGRGRSRELVAAQGDGTVYARHIVTTSNVVIARDGGRPMIWDDALAKHPELFASLPRSLVFVNWHYGSEPSYQPYIDRIARGGFEQMVAPGALNWNEIYPDLDAALGNIDRFVTEGKRSHVLGLFQTVWHDDGETLFEATWYPIVFAAASAWERDAVDRTRFDDDFSPLFFGTDDARYGADLVALGRARTLLRGHDRREYGDYLFWADPFAPDLAPATPLAGSDDADLAAMAQIRLAAEDVMTHLRSSPPPPLHAAAARVMALAAQRYDLLGRDAQIAREARAYYDDARANARAGHDGYVYRGLFVTKYLFWEQRDAMLAIEPLVRAAWEYENRASHEASVLERYHLAADRAIERADRISDTVYRDYVATKTLPTFEDAIGTAVR